MSTTDGLVLGRPKGKLVNRWLVSGVFVLGCSGLLWGSTWLRPTRTASDTARTPVLVELFTSQGCSSCPPADELLIMLDEEQFVAEALVIPLSEHVDYWNSLGWSDPFSAPIFTQRQQEYGNLLASGTVYTPQMVVDGQMEFVGSERDIAQQAIAGAAVAPKAEIALAMTRGGGRSPVNVEVMLAGLSRLGPLSDADIWFAVTEEGLVTNVRRGENAHRRLRHAAVVRRLKQIATLPMPVPDRFTTAIQVALEPEWQVGALRLVVFLQEQKSRRVLGATQVRLE